MLSWCGQADLVKYEMRIVVTELVESLVLASWFLQTRLFSYNRESKIPPFFKRLHNQCDQDDCDAFQMIDWSKVYIMLFGLFGWYAADIAEERRDDIEQQRT